MISVKKQTTLHTLLLTLFFLSGCSALIYQIIWQRMLFTLFGIDLDSVTIIVSVFMFGLGIGGILGGVIADLLPSTLLKLYIVIEFSIGLFGFMSFEIIEKIGGIAGMINIFSMGMLVFLILACPTILMGATFPILVTHINRTNHNIGQSVGQLYYANTIGGALGAFLAGVILLNYMEIPSIINFAAFLNFFIGIIAMIYFGRKK